MSAPPTPHGEGLDEDQRLMARVREGDREAFALLHDRYGTPVMRFLHGLCQDRTLAEDLTQETFLRAWAAAGRWRPTGKVSTWLFQIAKRRFFTRRAQQRLRREREARAAAERQERSSVASPSMRLEHSEEVERIRRTLLDLSPKLRLVFVLVRLEGQGYRDTAEIAGLKIGTVKSRMAAAEAFLRARLMEE